jgi:hypothetical protein
MEAKISPAQDVSSDVFVIAMLFFTLLRVRPRSWIFFHHRNKGAHTGYYLDLPPKPLQVFEWGPISREQWRQNREKYSYQYVCVMDQESGGVWYQRKAPRYWSDEHPPFHVRIIRPNWAGMALEAMGKGKARIRLVQKDVQTPAGQQKKAYVYEIVPR